MPRITLWPSIDGGTHRRTSAGSLSIRAPEGMHLQIAPSSQMSSAFDLTINGRPLRVNAEEQATLLDVLRNDLGLRATRFGCGQEQCGACMVLIDGEPAYACTRLVSTLAGKRVVTVEGLAEDGALEPLQQAFIAEQAGQCGFCLSGILVSAKALLDRNPAPSRAEIAAALDKNLCRCGVHNRVIRAVQRAAAARSGEDRPMEQDRQT